MGDGNALPVCKDFRNGRCSRSEDTCRFAHASDKHRIVDNYVTCCIDFLKNRCNREDPPCRYFHPPPHLKKRLTSNYYENHQTQPSRNDYGSGSMSGGYGGGGGMYGGGMGGMGGLDPQMLNNYKAMLSAAIQQVGEWGNLSGFGGGGYGGSGGGVGGYKSNHITIEVCREFLHGRCKRDECRYAHPEKQVEILPDNSVTPCMDFVTRECNRDRCKYFHPPLHLQEKIQSRRKGGESSSYGRKRRRSGEENGGGKFSRFS